jgi:hypothetical protein
MMHGRGKSDFAIVAVKPANKAEHPAEQSAVEAEPVERRGGKSCIRPLAPMDAHDGWAIPMAANSRTPIFPRANSRTPIRRGVGGKSMTPLPTAVLKSTSFP